jgi:16S rRNA (guanine527-N7)-methyltransferase
MIIPAFSNAEVPTLPEMLSVWQQTLNWQPDEEQQCQFQHLYELVLAGNRQLNLTRITDPLDFWEKHLWDSLRGIASLLCPHQLSKGAVTPATRVALSPSIEERPAMEVSSQQPRVIDIGTGGGFPGIPVAIARRDWTVTLLDSTRKKIAFLENLRSTLALENVLSLCDRAEQVGQDPRYRQRFEIALIRAVGPASVCAEYALPLLAIGGLAVLYRGQWTASEALTLQPAVEALGGVIESTAEFTTPVSQSMRHCLYLRKVTLTPSEFPRPVGVPAQQPL